MLEVMVLLFIFCLLQVRFIAGHYNELTVSVNSVSKYLWINFKGMLTHLFIHTQTYTQRRWCTSILTYTYMHGTYIYVCLFIFLPVLSYSLSEKSSYNSRDLLCMIIFTVLRNGIFHCLEANKTHGRNTSITSLLLSHALS